MKYVLLLSALALQAAADVKIHQEPNRVLVSIDGKPFTALHHGETTLKPFLHPLHAPTGTVVTRGWPVEPVDGDTKDHPHHEGIWFTHGDVNGFDFWANAKQSPKQGKIVVDKVLRAQGGAKHGIIWFDARWLDPQGKALLKESRRMTFYGDHKIDFDITLTAETESVKFGDTKEGTFAIRLADALTEKRKGAILTNAEGAQGMANVWGKPSPWVDYAGKMGEETVGVAIFDHPNNPKHPTTWHARDYGLFAANIFGLHDFRNDPKQDGSVTLEPGKSMRFRYRLLVHPGDTKSANLAEAYHAYRQANAK